MASTTSPAAPAAAPASLRSEFLRTLVERGYLHQCTDLDALDAAAASRSVTGYIGFDATADSLHVGSLIQIMMLRHMQRTGHRPVVLMGGGTTKVGDPSGKDKSRQLLSNERIAANIAGIRRVFERYLDFGDDAALMADNSEWLDALRYIPFLREYGRHFSVNRMLGFESVKQRLDREQPLSFLEFNYMVLQAYDFLELGRRHGCRLQMGGSDQWGNIVCGVELGRRAAGLELYGLTSPLLATASGAKMGKTADGAVWLNPDRFSPYAYWQYWRNTEDADVGRFLRLFTELPARRGRAPRGAGRRGDQRGEGGSGDRGDGPLSRAGGSAGSRGDGAAHVWWARRPAGGRKFRRPGCKGDGDRRAPDNRSFPVPPGRRDRALRPPARGRPREEQQRGAPAHSRRRRPGQRRAVPERNRHGGTG